MKFSFQEYRVQDPTIPQQDYYREESHSHVCAGAMYVLQLMYHVEDCVKDIEDVEEYQQSYKKRIHLCDIRY